MIKYTKHIDLRHSSSTKLELLSDVWVKFSCLNERFNLKPHEKICFKVSKGFETDGASIPRFATLFIPKTTWWILLSSIAHDWIWGEHFIEAYVYDENKKEITKELGVQYLSYKEGNQVMEEKMLDFNNPGVITWLKVGFVFYSLEVIRLFK